MTGLYQDDGYGTFHGISKPMIDRKKKEIIKICKLCGLPMDTECKLENW